MILRLDPNQIKSDFFEFCTKNEILRNRVLGLADEYIRKDLTKLDTSCLKDFDRKRFREVFSNYLYPIKSTKDFGMFKIDYLIALVYNILNNKSLNKFILSDTYVRIKSRERYRHTRRKEYGYKLDRMLKSLSSRMKAVNHSDTVDKSKKELRKREMDSYVGLDKWYARAGILRDPEKEEKEMRSRDSRMNLDWIKYSKNL